MGNNLSVEEKVFKVAKSGDHAELRIILAQLHRQGANIKHYIEFQDVTGQTPLIAACSRGYYAVADMLLRHGANLHHVTRSPDRSTALHEAVNRNQSSIVDILLQYGANPFLENGRGLTSVDIAINRGNEKILRKLEQRSDFTGSLLLKIPRFMGLGAEWKSRWCVIMPRYQAGQGQDRIARTLLVCYKDPWDVLPAVKVWLDGAVARSVVGSKGTSVLQCALALHRNHAPASGAHLTGDTSVGYTMHLRPKDGATQSSEALRRFMDIVNCSRSSTPPSQPPPGPGPSQGQGQGAGATPPQTPYYTAPHTPVASPSQSRTESDEAMARRLQAEYDNELAAAKLAPPANLLDDRVSQPYSFGGGAGLSSGSAYPDIHSAHHSHNPSSSSMHSVPSAPLYPTINPTDTAPYIHAEGNSHVNGGSVDWGREAGAAATIPPTATSYMPSHQAAPSASPSKLDAAARADDDDEAGQCVICMAAPATAGFVHGDSVHKCCCAPCALDLKKSHGKCPLCREQIQHTILNFY